MDFDPVNEERRQLTLEEFEAILQQAAEDYANESENEWMDSPHTWAEWMASFTRWMSW